MTARPVQVHWRDLGDYADDGWDQLRCLYAYFALSGEILYLGEAVYERWCRDAKADFWDDLERDRGLFHHRPAVGTLALAPGFRLTKELLADVESLLIQRLLPWGYIQGRVTRIQRQGLLIVAVRLSPFADALFGIS